MTAQDPQDPQDPQDVQTHPTGSSKQKYEEFEKRKAQEAQEAGIARIKKSILRDIDMHYRDLTSPIPIAELTRPFNKTCKSLGTSPLDIMYEMEAAKLLVLRKSHAGNRVAIGIKQLDHIKENLNNAADPDELDFAIIEMLEEYDIVAERRKARIREARKAAQV